MINHRLISGNFADPPVSIREDVRQFIEANRFTWVFAQDLGFAAPPGCADMPTSYFIDKDGIVRAVHIGPLNAANLQSNLQKVLHLPVK
jgi:hypothetical protein